MKKGDEKFYNKLITAVENEEGLYVKGNPIYMSKYKRDTVWERVAMITGRKKTECKKRWRYLREKFVRLYNRQFDSCSSVFGADVYNWPFYNQMMFLKDHIEKRPRSRPPRTGEFYFSTPLCKFSQDTTYMERDYIITNDISTQTDFDLSSDTTANSESTECDNWLNDNVNTKENHYFFSVASLMQTLDQRVKSELKNKFVHAVKEELKKIA